MKRLELVLKRSPIQGFKRAVKKQDELVNYYFSNGSCHYINGRIHLQKALDELDYKDGKIIIWDYNKENLIYRKKYLQHTRTG